MLVALLLLALAQPAGGEGQTSLKVDVQVGGAEGGALHGEGTGACAHFAKPGDSYDWSVVYSDVSGNAALQSVRLYTREASSGSTDQVVVMIVAGTRIWSINSVPGGERSGRGTATFTKAGDGAHVEVDGTTADGARLHAAIDCARVSG